jgi:hypothetical protein
LDMFRVSLEAIGVLEVALPLYIFTNLVEKFNPAESTDWRKMFLLFPVFAAITLLFTLVFSRMFNNDMRREASVGMYLHNPTFVPLSILTGVYGAGSPYIVDLFLFTSYSAAFYFNFYRFFFRKSPSETKELEPSGPGNRKFKLDIKKILNPILQTTVIALIIKFTGLDRYVPDLVLSVTNHAGAMLFPLVMILGGYIYIDLKSSGKL